MAKRKVKHDKKRSKRGRRMRASRPVWTRSMAVMLLLLLAGSVIGAGTMVYDYDTYYYGDRTNAVLNTPEILIAGEDTPILITTENKDGSPKPYQDVKITIDSDSGKKVLFKGKTDGSGFLATDVAIPKTSGSARLIVDAGGERIIEDIMVINSTSNPKSKILISTDKPIYQPGQTVHIRTIAFTGANFTAVAAPTTYQVTDANGDRIFRETVQANEYGIASYDFPLSDQLPLGTYVIKASLSNEVHTEIPILVKRYTLPKFRIELEDVKPWYLVEDMVHGTVNVTYMFGEPVDGNVVMDIKAREDPAYAEDDWRFWEQPEYDREEVITGTLVDGEFQFTFSISQFSGNWGGNRGRFTDLNYAAYFIDINVTVTDEAGHKEDEKYELTVASMPNRPLIMAESFMKDHNSRLYILVMDPVGEPLPDKDVEVRYHSYDDGTKTYNKVTDEKGLATVDIYYLGPGTITIMVKEPRSSEYFYYVNGNSKIKIEAEKRNFEPGTMAEFTVTFDHGDVDPIGNTISYHVMSEGLILKGGSVMLNGDEGTISLPIESMMAPVSEIRVFKTLKDGVLATDAIFFTVERPVDLDVDINLVGGTYRTSATVGIDFKVRAPDGNLGGPTALGVKIVDQSVYELGQRLVSQDEVFLGLRGNSKGPRYDVAMYMFSPSAPVPSMEGVVYAHGADTGEGMLSVHSSYSDFMSSAYQRKTELVQGYWTVLLFGGIIGMMALLGWAVRRRIGAGMSLLALFMVSIAIMAAFSTGPSMFLPEGAQTSDPGSMDLRQWDNRRMVMAMEDRGGALLGGPSIGSLFETGSDGSDSGPNTIGGVMAFSKGLRVREYFPETWYWNPFIITDQSGNAHLDLTTPDTITTWGIDAAASTMDGRFGIGQENITVFQEFFVEPDLPTYLVRNDTVRTPVLVYNYLDHEINVTVTMSNESWMDIDGNTTENVIVPEGSTRGVNFTIRALDVGTHTVRVGGKVGNINDVVVREVLVKPDGWKKSQINNGQLEGSDGEVTTVVQHPRRIPKSENSYIKIYGSIAGVALDGLENFIMFAYGCGEQSTSVLTVNLAAYRNLQIYEADSNTIEQVRRYVIQSIQYEARYLVPAAGGRAIVWHPGESPDIWLTAWASYAYKDLEDAGFGIDEAILDGMVTYMLANQGFDGSWSFPDIGHWNINDELLDKKVASTAYMVNALLYAGHPADDKIQRAINFIVSNLDQDDSAFTLSTVLQGLAMAESHEGLRSDLADRLETLKKGGPKEGTFYWDWMVPGKEDCKYCSKGNNVETTAYVVEALMKQDAHRELVTGGLRYLLDTRDRGVWDNTHSTAVALRAVNLEDTFRAKDMTVTIEADGKKIKTIRVDETNNDMVFLTDTRPYLNETNITDFKVKTSGSGSILFQVVYEEYLPWDLYDGGQEALDLEVDVRRFHLDFKVTYNGIRPKLKMVLLEVPIPARITVDERQFQNMITKGTINDYENLDGKLVRFYIDSLEKGETRPISFDVSFDGWGRTTMNEVVAFDMYDPALRDVLTPITFTRMD